MLGPRGRPPSRPFRFLDPVATKLFELLLKISSQLFSLLTDIGSIRFKVLDVLNGNRDVIIVVLISDSQRQLTVSGKEGTSFSAAVIFLEPLLQA